MTLFDLILRKVSSTVTSMLWSLRQTYLLWIELQNDAGIKLLSRITSTSFSFPKGKLMRLYQAEIPNYPPHYYPVVFYSKTLLSGVINTRPPHSRLKHIRRWSMRRMQPREREGGTQLPLARTYRKKRRRQEPTGTKETAKMGLFTVSVRPRLRAPDGMLIHSERNSSARRGARKTRTEGPQLCGS